MALLKEDEKLHLDLCTAVENSVKAIRMGKRDVPDEGVKTVDAAEATETVLDEVVEEVKTKKKK